MAEDDVIDPLDDAKPDDGVSLEEDVVLDDGLDVEVVDEINEDDFDEDFDDDFEEEIQGEYNLEDDQYGEEFDDQFGHLTDPSKAPPKKVIDKTPVKKPRKKKT